MQHGCAALHAQAGAAALRIKLAILIGVGLHTGFEGHMAGKLCAQSLCIGLPSQQFGIG